MGVDDARRILEDYGSADPSRVLEVAREIVPLVRTGPVREYLSKKIESARSEGTREACAQLRPYLEWYVQGGR